VYPLKDETYIWSLIARKFSGEATEAELGELEELLRKQPAWQYSYEMLSSWWMLFKNQDIEEDASASFAHVRELIGTHEVQQPAESPVAVAPWDMPGYRKKTWKKWLVAAALAAVIGLGGALLLKTRPLDAGAGQATASSQQSGLSEISTRYGSKSKVTLPDGTMVWLNSGSNFTYDNNHFGETGREVTLSGEAFFKVAKDPGHPFIIHAGKIDIRVLGTSFDVKSYPDDATTTATLIQGAIEVSFADQPQKTVRLAPSEKLVVFNDDEQVLQNPSSLKSAGRQGYQITPVTVIPSDSTVVETSWVENKLAFRGESFEQLAVQMERWYNVHINFSSSAVKQYRFTGIFTTESLDQALKALQITAPFRYRIEKNEVYISKP
jgi:ferric-dicitrate binding protein FerR (iron transport regulator)